MPYATNKLFLDDTRQPPEGFRLAKDGEDFLHYLDKCPEGFSEIWFDHDLGEVGTMTGAHCLTELINRCEIQGYPKPTRIVMHTASPYMRQAMIQQARKYFTEAQVIEADGLLIPQRRIYAA